MYLVHPDCPNHSNQKQGFQQSKGQKVLRSSTCWYRWWVRSEWIWKNLGIYRDFQPRDYKKYKCEKTSKADYLVPNYHNRLNAKKVQFRKAALFASKAKIFFEKKFEWSNRISKTIDFSHCTMNIFGSKSSHLNNRIIERFFFNGCFWNQKCS